MVNENIHDLKERKILDWLDIDTIWKDHQDRMSHFSTPPRYHIYLLAIWQERSRDSQTPVQWRFSLEDPQTGQRHGFASLGALMVVLEKVLAE